MKQDLIVRGSELVAVSELSVLKALGRIAACQGCSPSVSRSFGAVLVEVLGAVNPMTEYVMCQAAPCPNCDRPMFENTLVRCEGERDECPAECIREYQPNLDETNFVLVDEWVIADAESCISGCEHCVANTETTFDYILDVVTDCDPTVTEYVLSGPARCPRCGHEVTEKTFVTS